MGRYLKQNSLVSIINSMKVIINTSTFKEVENEPITDVINRLVDGLFEQNSKFKFVILKPMGVNGNKFLKKDNYNIHSYRYFFINKYQTFGTQGIKPSIQKNKFNIFKLIFLLISQFVSLNKLIKRENPDYIYAHWFFPQAFITAILAKYYDVKFIYTSHGSDVQLFNSLGFIGKYIIRKVTDSSHRYTAVSDLTLQQINRNFNSEELNPNKFKVIPMGIDEKYFKVKNQLEKKHNDYLRFLYVGRLVDYKGVELLLTALSQYKLKNDNFKLDILGTGILEEKLVSKVEEFDLTSNVVFHGFKNFNEKIQMIERSNIFFIPSIIKKTQLEGGPLTLMEAMATGGVCAVSDSVGFATYCNSSNSLLFRSGDVKHLKSKIEEYACMKKTEIIGIQQAAARTADFFRFSNISRIHMEFLFSE